MAIRLDAYELKQVLQLTPPEQNILIVGRHGIGKSEIIREVYQHIGLPVEAFFLGQMSDPGDLIGLLHKDEATGHSIFLPPYWWPVKNQPVALFLDEMNRARPEILQAVYDLALNRRLAGKDLPVGSRVVAAVNHGEEYQLTELDPALVSRFNVYEFVPSVEDWLLWAKENGLDERVINFIHATPMLLDPVPEREDLVGYQDLAKTPDRRAWVRVARFMAEHASLQSIHVKTIAGMVGVHAAMALQQHIASTQQISPEELLRHWRKYRTKVKTWPLHELLQMNERLLLWLHGETGQIKAADTKTLQKNLLAYLKDLKTWRQNEAIAHFTSLLENPKYSQAMTFCSGSVEIVKVLTDYIDGIRG